MKRVAFLFAACLALAGCSTMTPSRYAVSADNNQLLKQFAGKSVELASMAEPVNYDSNCRLMGPIQAADNMTISQFIQDAFNDEFRFAGLYSATGVKLNGTLDRVQFSSSAGVTNGWWDLAITLKSSNGKSLSAENKYEFKSGFDAITACNQTAQALSAAVQDLIKTTISAPAFQALL